MNRLCIQKINLNHKLTLKVNEVLSDFWRYSVLFCSLLKPSIIMCFHYSVIFIFNLLLEINDTKLSPNIECQQKTES